MLDIKFIRENSELVKAAAKDKRVDVDIDKLLKLDGKRRKLQDALNELQNERNVAAKSKDIEKGKELKKKVTEQEKAFKKVEDQYLRLMAEVPNVPSDDTPVGKDESENVVLRQVGKKPSFDFKPKEHSELGKNLGMIEKEKAAKISGARFAYLMGDLVLLQFALIQFALSVLTDEETLKAIAKEARLKVSTKTFIPVIPPVMIRPEVMQKMARLEPKEDRYHTEADDLYLIGSAEHTLGPLHMNEVLREEDLPIRYVGYSTNFRREAGTYGKDMKGILRLHHFDKLEVESFTTPESSKDEQDFIVAIQEHLMQALELPYQVVQMCTGDMGAPNARQIDIETWMPGQGVYRETHTSDLMNDYQSRRLGTKVKLGDKTKVYVHMNDATIFAIGRAIVAIMENYQQKDGSIVVPEVLRPFMGGKNKMEALK